MANCLVCGVEFTPKHGSAGKYCSRACFYEANKGSVHKRRIPDAVCPTCGKVFHPKNRKPGRKTYYCSKECAGQVAPEKQCPVCGEMFKAGCDRKTYCSVACAGKGNAEKRRKYANASEAKKAYYERYKERTAPEREAKKQERESLAQARKAKREAEQERVRAEKMHPCEVCGAVTDRPKYCSEPCKNKAHHRRKEITRRHKLRDNGEVDYSVTLDKLIKRDRNTCHICGGKCDMKDGETVDGAFIAGDSYPSIDHLIPVAHGGVHTWDNVKLAHRICNTKKSARRVFETEGGQMRLAI